MIRLLYLEDEPKVVRSFREDLEELIAHDGFSPIELVHASSYSEALPLLATADIVLSDLNCPGREGQHADKANSGGLDLLHAVRTLEKSTSRTIPFGLASGQELADVYILLGKNHPGISAPKHFASKPFSYASIKNILSALVKEFGEQPGT